MKTLLRLAYSLQDGLAPASHRRHTLVAAALAAEIRNQPGLAEWVRQLSQCSQRQRQTMLLAAARSLRGEWATLGVADALRRIGQHPGLFRHTVAALAAEQVSAPTVAPQFAAV